VSAAGPLNMCGLNTCEVYTQHAQHFLVSAIDDKHKNFQILNFRIDFLSGGARPVKFGIAGSADRSGGRDTSALAVKKLAGCAGASASPRRAK
jgi:hypothetical protein